MRNNWHTWLCTFKNKAWWFDLITVFLDSWPTWEHLVVVIRGRLVWISLKGVASNIFPTVTLQSLCCWPWEGQLKNVTLLNNVYETGQLGRLSFCSEIVNSISFLPFPCPYSHLFAFTNCWGGEFGFVNREKSFIGEWQEKRWEPWRGQKCIWLLSNLLSWLWASLEKEVRDCATLPHTELPWGQGDWVGPRVGEATLHSCANHCKKQWLWEHPKVELLVWALASHNWQGQKHFCR